jgi:hypothetical protein
VWNKSGQVNPKHKLKSTFDTPEVQCVIRSATYIAAIDAILPCNWRRQYSVFSKRRTQSLQTSKQSAKFLHRME